MTDDSNDNRLEQVFACIQKGNELEKESNHLGAANEFHCAVTWLDRLIHDNDDNNNNNDNNANDEEEQEKIVQLYQQQSMEYRKRAQTCFVKSLQDDKEEEKQDEDVQALRNRLYGLLYGGKEEEEEEQSPEKKQSSLEERLLELNASLPSGFKTADERMQDINRGLNRLGLSSIYTQQTNASSIEDPTPETPEQQIAQIIAQAKDEAKFEQDKKESEDDYDSDDDSDKDEDSVDDSDDTGHLFSPENQSKVKKLLIKTQVKVAELIAMLPDETQHEDGEIMDESGSMNVARGRLLLMDVRKQTIKALSLWPGTNDE